MTFGKEQLTPATIEWIELTSGNPEKLLAKIAEQEAIIVRLRQENADLQRRLQIAAAVPPPVPVSSSTSATARPQAVSSTHGKLSYTISPIICGPFEERS